MPLQITRNNAYMRFTDYRDLLKTLRQVDSALAKKVRKDVRKEIGPMRTGIRNSIPASAPLSGMVNRIGRLQWNEGKPARSVVIDTRPSRAARKGLTGSLVKLVVGSPATVMSDMAGRSGAWIGARPLAKGTKKAAMVVKNGKYKGQMGYAYTYKNGVSGRIHRNTGGQGRGMIQNLGNTASRYVWPAAERALPETRLAVRRVLEDAYDSINSDLRSK
jgi:hypothetical protein